ncbi:MAG: Ig-like domain-containing protein, partial [Gemmatimonadales bacterium]
MSFVRSGHRLALLSFAAAAVTVTCSKSDGTVEPPVPTTLQLTPATRAFTGLGQTQQFAATVFDQRGDSMAGAGVGVTWASSNTGIVTVSTGGLATSAGAGSAFVRATLGAVIDSAPVSVTQTAGRLEVSGGDGQTGPIAQQLLLPIQVRVLDAGGFSMPNVDVQFTVTQGGGTVAAARDTTAINGRASTFWTVGTSTTSGQQLTASLVAGGVAPITFTATATAGPSDTVVVHAGDAQTAGSGTQLPVEPAVRVRDAFNNLKAGAPVTFTVTAGGGFVSSPQDTTDASGIASVRWTLGAAGTNTIVATVAGAGIGGNPVSFTATATAPGAPASIAVSEGDNQTNLQGFALNVAPAVEVRDASNNPVGGVQVDFAPSGSGGVTGSPATTSVFGVARVGSWTVELGPNTLTATAAGVATPATLSATGVTSSFNIVLRPLTALTGPQQAAFDDAAATWQTLIYGDIPDLFIDSIAAGTCGSNSPAIVR